MRPWYEIMNELDDESNKQAASHQQTLAQHLANMKAEAVLPYATSQAQENLSLDQQRLPYLKTQTTAADLANQAAAKRLPFVIPKEKAQEDLQKAQAAYYSNKGLGNNAADYSIVKTTHGLARVNKATGELSPITDASGHVAQPLLSNNVLAKGPDGQWHITSQGLVPGSSQPASSQASSTTMTTQTPTTSASGSNITQSMASPHSRFSTGGSTLTDSQTNKSLSIPTSAEAAKLQNSIISSRVAVPDLVTSFNKISPMLGDTSSLGGPMLRAEGHFKRAMGMSTPKLDNYQSETQAGITTTADTLLKTYGLTGVASNRQALEHALQPHEGDTKASYARRIATVVSGLIDRGNSYAKVLKGGLPLDQNYNLGDVKSAIENKVYNTLMTAQPNSSTSVPRGMVVMSYKDKLKLVPQDKEQLALKYGYVRENND